MSSSDDDMIHEFSVEATDMLDQAETDLLSLDKGGDFKKCYDSIFRVFHSLKGGAGMLGLDALQKHMHSLENTLSVLKTKAQLAPEETNYFLEGVDAGRAILAGKEVQFNYEVKSASPEVPRVHAVKAPALEKTDQALAYVVDDEPDILESLCDILEEGGIRTRSFTNPAEALKAIDELPPDIVLTDMKMPQMSGMDLIHKIHDRHPDIPMIQISGYITTETLHEAIQAGVFAAIEKPFRMNIVLTCSLAAIKQHRTIKMLRRGVNLLLYQFSDLEDFLKSHGKHDVAKTSRTELTTLLAQFKELSTKKAS